MEERRLTLVQHLEELRRRILVIVLVMVAGAIISYRFIDQILDFITGPAGGLNFIYLSPPELFIAYMKISLVSGFVLTLPITLFQIWLFVKPGLYQKERKRLLFALFMAIIFFLLGMAFAYFIIVPMTIQFFLQMSTDQIAPLFTFDSYIGFVSSLLFSFGLVFELPLLIILLSHLNLVTPALLKKSRKVIILVIFVVAAIMTPPDVISQCLMAIPMVFLYELSLWVATWMERKKRKKALA